MGVRAIWVISTLPKNLGRVLFSRKFSTVEKQAKEALDDRYVGVPSDNDFSLNLFLTLGLSQESKQFVEWRDRSSKDIYLPVVGVKIKETELWPILLFHQESYILCCLPFVKHDAEDIYYASSVSIAFSVLLGIGSFLGPNAVYMNELDERLMELDNYLAVSMPFGSPSDTDSSSIVAFYNETSHFVEKTLAKQSYKAKSSMSIEVCEYVRSSQSDHGSSAEIYGFVNVKLESLTHASEISLTLGHSSNGQTLSFDSIIFHPCVQMLSSAGSGVSGVPKKFWFMPMLHHFTLCYYTTHCYSLPISGMYKMKGTSLVELLIKLKIEESLNNFCSFEVLIPFFHRGPIMNFDFKATQGFLHSSDDKHSLRWKIGSKLTSKSLEVFLTAKVRFSNRSFDLQNEPFCVEKNSYIQVFFKKLNDTLSGCAVDPKSVIVSPPQKMKIFTESSTQNGEFVIWNSFGDVPFPVVTKTKWPEE